MKYKNIVFDVGGVLLHYRWMEMLAEYGLSEADADRFAAEIFPDPLWLEFDYENISFSEVVDLYAQKFPHFADPIRWFFGHAHEMPIWLPDVWAEVRRLKKAGYHLYVLSNYSSYLLDLHVGKAAFWEDMDGKVVSYQIHSVKPDPTIYQELFSRYGIRPEESLFFDDRQANVAAGVRLGMDGIVITGKEQLIREIHKLLGEDK